MRPAVGDVVRGRVERVENYGLYLRAGDLTVLVLIPDVRPGPPGPLDLKSYAKPGDEFDARIVLYPYPERLPDYARGSIRAASAP